jgi:hypothetical protein
MTDPSGASRTLPANGRPSKPVVAEPGYVVLPQQPLGDSPSRRSRWVVHNKEIA